ncbi:hypothetical protein [Hymenobacter convexus]|uniref:hypothetical protein n=1 Tax=Hymenobacter sp. CA1UV-4 TaxID=3063782 RepID=UPI0027132130|nr:hypothetical protein [Hymenobacter sp. CA1UV-4]MDO7850767.1 hypothetical protein [Hymenobacter sp. CA1UV-4]
MTGKRCLWPMLGCLSWFAGLAQAQTAAGPCPPVAGLVPSLDSSSAAPVERYLARAVAMNGLCEELMPAPFAWNQANDKTPCYTGGPPNDPASYNDSLTCRGLCNYPYCPANFAADVSLLVRLKASFVQFAASAWNSPERFLPGSEYLQAAAQTVRRINEEYDCAGLARPFIQASVLENADPGPVCGAPGTPCAAWMQPGPPGTNSGVNRVLIPPEVIAEFAAEMQADSVRTYYLDEAGQPRSGLKFRFSRLTYLFDNTSYTPDLTKLEGRMWLFYQAKTYLDLGYTSLHMGQPKVWGKLYPVMGEARAQALHQVAVLIGRIRRYARTTPGHANAALVLTAEPMSEVDNNGQHTVKLIDGTTAAGRDRYIFDFAMATMRARETSPALDDRANTNAGTSYQCPVVAPAALNTPACAGQFMATIDPCHGFNFLPDGGGATALGQAYASQLPYVVYFDHGNTILRKANGDLAPTGQLSPGNMGTWNWDDSGWFSAALSDACQADWLRFQFANVRSFSAAQLGFLAAPGRLINSLRVGLDLGPGLPDRPEAAVPDYRLAAHPAVAAAVAAAWEPTVPRVTLRATPGAGLSLGQCALSTFLHRTFRQLPAWRGAVANPDVTSIYSWRITGPRGPEPAVMGPVLTFFPTEPGEYTVTLQQDNMGLPVATHGIYSYRVPGVGAVAEVCLTRNERRAARRAAQAP